MSRISRERSAVGQGSHLRGFGLPLECSHMATAVERSGCGFGVVIDRFDLQRQFAARQAELDGMAPIEAMGARGLTRAAGVSPTTAT